MLLSACAYVKPGEISRGGLTIGKRRIKRRRKRVKKLHEISQLEVLREELNSRSTEAQAVVRVLDTLGAWRGRDPDWKDPGVRRAVDRLNLLAYATPVVLRLTAGPQEIPPDDELGESLRHVAAKLRTRTPRPPVSYIGRAGKRAELVFLLWRFFDQQWWRQLRRCERCRKWFIDAGRNHMARCCSRSCSTAACKVRWRAGLAKPRAARRKRQALRTRSGKPPAG